MPIELIKAHLMDTFLFDFWNTMNVVWDSFTDYLLIYFKMNVLIIVLFAVFIGLTFVYLWINVLVYTHNRRKTAKLIVALFEIDKRDIEHYINDISNFEVLTKKFWVERNNLNEKNLDFSSDDDTYQVFQTRLNKRSDDLKKSIVQKVQISCELIRSYRPSEIETTVPPATARS